MPNPGKRKSMRGMGADAFFELGTDQQDTLPAEQQTGKPVNPQNSKPVEPSTDKTGSQQNSVLVESLPSETASQEDGKTVFIKATYYITPEQDLKLDRVRIARKSRKQKIDKSGLIRELIDLLEEL